MKYIAYCTKGLEEIVRNEITATISKVIILEQADKRVIFETDSAFENLIQLRTVDDLGIVLFTDIASKPEDLLLITSKINLKESQKIISQFREIRPDVFSITASFAGTPFKAKEIVKIISQEISEKYLWHYSELDHTNFDLRIFIDHKKLVISARLTTESLSHRKYKTDSKIGSLKPTVAAAMIQLGVNGEKDLKIVDNFCGSGTILCEGFLMGNQIYGGDIDPESVSIAKSNLKNLHYTGDGKILLQDALETRWPSSFFDYAVSNLPWDEQIKVVRITDLYREILREYARVIKPAGSICLLVSKPELLIKHAKVFFPDAKITPDKIGLLGQNPTIVLIQRPHLS